MLNDVFVEYNLSKASIDRFYKRILSSCHCLEDSGVICSRCSRFAKLQAETQEFLLSGLELFFDEVT